MHEGTVGIRTVSITLAQEKIMSTIKTIQDLTNQEYKWGFVTDVEEDTIPKG